MICALVTGVQTFALPMCAACGEYPNPSGRGSGKGHAGQIAGATGASGAGSDFRFSVSGRLSQMIAAMEKTTLAIVIVAASPKCSAICPVSSGAKKLKIRPQLKIDAAVDRR